MPHFVSEQSYGKCNVRLTKLSRANNRHSIVELSADIQLDGDFDAAYTAADNRLVVPTDTMKNTVYVLAKQHDIPSIESFGQMLGKHFIDHFDHVTRATVHLSEQPWQRILVDETGHDHAFLASNSFRATAVVSADRDSVKTTSGIEDLTVLKTTDSGFSDFLKDGYTTLADTDDRIFGTTITAEWDYADDTADWSNCREIIRETLLKVFATHDSKSVQHTLYAMASAALDACDAVQSIKLQMPNQHRLLVDLTPFGLDNDNEIFVPTSEPFGMISATVERGAD